MLPLSVSVAPTAWLEIDAGTELLMEQAEHMDEPIWPRDDDEESL